MKAGISFEPAPLDQVGAARNLQVHRDAGARETAP